MIKCKNPHAYGDKCVVSMNAKENPRGIFCCDIAEDFGFSEERVLRFCKHAEYAEEVKKQTNAERIRGMTDEELADFIEMKQFFAIARNGTDGEEYTLQWLQSEVEE